ncbi:uncharacterized protein LY89DRAFT_685326 [Mollisia scopiformis]|uniref:Peptidase A1 domain-containing protein n=1 Tax=Mollisia scopiformis TaxID=149040 RepID=A0A194X825_MOLSC|nr:uncharacterized protein LY89DRAFT_685326 [Mollisia scopiformis]KUJ16316.1 hypothetical protein LY89DRAFT_685326 [Mollisia scopiformis]
MPQLIEKQILDAPIWSILLVNGKEGIFSMGGTSVASDREVERETADDLDRIGGHQSRQEEHGRNEHNSRKSEDDLNEWKWIKVQGAEGWWQVLMRGIWIDGVKILANQPAVLDVNTPFIIAPPLAARTFYSSISGSKQLPPPFDQFTAYPCFNPPRVHFEFASWNFEVLKGKRDQGTFSPGGRFSLGRMTTGSGYCLGIVVESRMGARAAEARESKSGVKVEGGDGLSDVWVIGEPFFRDVQIAFNWRDKLVGMQRA